MYLEKYKVYIQFMFFYVVSHLCSFNKRSRMIVVRGTVKTGNGTERNAKMKFKQVMSLVFSCYSIRQV